MMVVGSIGGWEDNFVTWCVERTDPLCGGWGDSAGGEVDVGCGAVCRGDGDGGRCWTA